MLSEKLEQFNPKSSEKQLDQQKEELIEKGFEGFEKDKRPNYRYYYHGSFSPLWEKIEQSGEFKFKEFIPNLNISPSSSFSFLEKIEDGSHWAVARAKHFSMEEKERFLEKGLSGEDGLIMIIEPENYLSHSSSEGVPNVFSTPDQIPEDIDKTVRTRNWVNYEFAMSKEPIFEHRQGEIRQLGMDRNHQRLPDGTWAELPKEQKLDILAEMPATSIKMVIKKNPEFLKILSEFRDELKAGGKADLSVYKDRLLVYFTQGKNILKDEIADKTELAENMITGELEYFIVTAIRRLYLNFEAYRGKKVINSRTEKNMCPEIKSKDQILEEIKILNSLEPENEVLKRYIEITTKNIVKNL